MTSNLIYNEQIRLAMDKWGASWFKFDEISGNVTDSKGTAIGTIIDATRVQGWNGEGSALNFNGSSYVNFDSKVIPVGEKSIRFKIKKANTPLSNETVLGVSHNSNDNGDTILINTNGLLYWISNRGVYGNTRFNLVSTKNICDDQWHDVLFTWDGTTNSSGVKIYIDDMSVENVSGKAINTETTIGTYNLRLGAMNNGSTPISHYFQGQLDELEIYNKALTQEDFILNKTLISLNNEYKKWDSGWQTVSTTTPSETQFLSDGMDSISPLLDRQVQSIPSIKMNKSEILLNNGKQFAKTIDLNKYMDIRKINVEVEQ